MSTPFESCGETVKGVFKRQRLYNSKLTPMRMHQFHSVMNSIMNKLDENLKKVYP